MKPCGDCEKPFAPRHWSQRYCSDLCRHRAKHKRRLNRGVTCRVKGCGEPELAGGYCTTHYWRNHKTGDVGVVHRIRRSYADAPSCAIAGCDAPATRGGKCEPHYLAAWRAARPLVACCMAGCPQPTAIGGRGWCDMHYSRWRLEGSPGEAARRNAPPGSPRPAASGYRYITVNGRSRLEHRVVMERMLDRPLRKFEEVHHKNGIRHDNSPENLELWVKSQPSGQRAEDLAAWVVTHYPELVQAILDERNQLRLNL